MNNSIITINNTDVSVKEYDSQRVVTFKDIDSVHNRPDGTARKRFNDNKSHFHEGEDYLKISASDIRTHNIMELSNKATEDVTLITESGYLMLVKSFTDDLAWEVQRQLVNTYFRAKSAAADLETLSPELRLLINLELKQKEQDKALQATNEKIDGIRGIITLSPSAWRSEARNLIVKIAHQWGGNEFIRDVQAEVFKLVDERAGASLETRLTNKRRRMAEEGVCKSKRDKLNKVDVIADDKKLIEIYLAVVKDMAIKYDVAA